MTLHFTATSPHVSPRAFLAALTDFSEERPELWPGLSPDFYRVHSSGECWAVVTEGSSCAGGIWERSHYDWSQPGVVMVRVIESNVFAAGSFWRYEIRTATGGGSRISFTSRRLGKNAKGKLLAALLQMFGARALRNDLEETLRRISASRERHIATTILTAPQRRQVGGSL